MWKIFLFLMANLIAVPAWSAVSSVTGTKTLVNIGGKDYYRFTGFMNGTVPTASRTYKTPITILYPKKASQSNRTAIINPKCYTMQEISYMDFGTQNMVSASCGEKLFTEKFLGGKGYTYVDLHWNKGVLDAADSMSPPKPIAGYHTGDIQEAMDAHQILADATSLVKAPPSGLSDMPAANIAIASAFSGGNGILREYFIHQYATNNYPRSHEYDGYLHVALGPLCIDMTLGTFNGAGYSFCGDPSGAHDPITESVGAGKVIAINSETDLQIFSGGFMRSTGSNFRYYEVPGSHLPKSFLNIAEEIFPDIQPEFRQNIANTWKPIGAMVENLRQWIKDGTTPPQSIAMEGLTAEPIYTGIPCSPMFGEELAGAPICDHFGNSPLFAGGGTNMVFDVARDEDGNALGGIRLPYSEVPLGEYNGLELGLFSEETQSFQLHPDLQAEWQRILAWEAGGYYERFDDSDINSLYLTNKIYVNKVVAAAQNALNKRWILPEDYVDYVVTAKNSKIGEQDSYSEAELEAAHGILF